MGYQARCVLVFSGLEWGRIMIALPSMLCVLVCYGRFPYKTNCGRHEWTQIDICDFLMMEWFHRASSPNKQNLEPILIYITDTFSTCERFSDGHVWFIIMFYRISYLCSKFFESMQNFRGRTRAVLDSFRSKPIILSWSFRRQIGIFRMSFLIYASFGGECCLLNIE